jgi:hypothetical protein
VGLSKVLDQHQLQGRSWRRMHLRRCVPGVPECLHPSGCQLPSSLLEGTSGWRGLFDNPVRPELFRVREAHNDVFDSCLLHLDVLGGPECLCALLIWKRVWNGVPKRRKCLLRAIALGINVLVMTNELHLD